MTDCADSRFCLGGLSGEANDVNLGPILVLPVSYSARGSRHCQGGISKPIGVNTPDLPKIK